MTRLLAATAMGLLFSGASWAADMAVPYYKGPPPPPPPTPYFSWTGLYVGVNGGSGWGNDDQHLNVGSFDDRSRVIQPEPLDVQAQLAPVGVGGIGGIGGIGGFPGVGLGLSQVGLEGVLAGGQVGFNYQVGPVVFGIEGNFDWANLRGTAPCLVVISCHTEVPWVGDATGRIGFSADRALIYAKGGVAWARFDYTDSLNLNPAVPFSLAATGSETRMGFVLGAGVEYAFTQAWSAKIEYDFYDFGTANSALHLVTNPGLPVAIPLTVDNEERFHVLKFGVNYRIGGF